MNLLSLTKEHIIFYILFIICIICIALYYKKYLGNNYLESFDTKSFDNPIHISNTDISNDIVNQTANNNMFRIQNAFNKYINIDPAITITNNGLLCDDSTNIASSNTCNISQNTGSGSNNNYISNGPECIVNGNNTPCSNYYSDGTIAKYSKINMDPLLESLVTQIISNCNNLINSDTGLLEQNSNIQSIIDNIKQQLNLQNQQAYFIKYNIKNLDEKQKIIDKTNKDFEKEENDINVNKINFSQFLDENDKNTSKQSLYYNIIIGLIITLIVLGVMNVFFSNIL